MVPSDLVQKLVTKGIDLVREKPTFFFVLDSFVASELNLVVTLKSLSYIGKIIVVIWYSYIEISVLWSDLVDKKNVCII